MHTNALFCHRVTAHYVRKEERVQTVNLYHWRAGCYVVSRVACQEHRAHSSVRVPVPQITSHLRLGEISHRRGWVSPRGRSEQAGTINPDADPGSLTAPAGVQKLQLKPKFHLAAFSSSVSQDPSDAKTLTGPGMRILCQKVMAQSQKCNTPTSRSPWRGLEGCPGVRRISNARLSEMAWKCRGNVKINWGLGRHLPKQEHTHPWLRQHFPRRDESNIYIFTYATRLQLPTRDDRKTYGK